MKELVLQTGLEHQEKAVEAIADALGGEVEFHQPYTPYENPILQWYADIDLLRNIKEVQQRNGITHIHSHVYSPKKRGYLNLDIKMETGTGKTYVQAHTMYELHRRYGINKFVIVVPTLAIKAGTAQFLKNQATQRHFENTRGYQTTMGLYEVQARPTKRGRIQYPASVRDFLMGSMQDTTRIHVLLLNMQLLTNAKVLSRDDYDFAPLGFHRPMDAIAATRPFVIIDEPHRISCGQSAYKKIESELKPQCIICYGATFPMEKLKRKAKSVEETMYLNLLYDLNAAEAFRQNLIKGVAKEHFQPISSANEKIKITRIERNSVTLMHTKSDKSRSHTLRKGDSLSVISDELGTLNIDGIRKGALLLSNSQIKRQGEEFTVETFSQSYQEEMIRLALQRHFERERLNFSCPIRMKTLALFFIDDIQSYRGEGEMGWLRITFERLLKERLTEELQSADGEYKDYLQASLEDIPACHAGYFSQDNSDSEESIAKEVDDILHNKLGLLSFRSQEGTYNVRRFLFSKWTLKEGWDNPNIFTITKLRSSGSEISKLQEVGRGLRLPVDEQGNRISNENFMLNYIVDFTEADFATKLVAEINGSRPTEIPDCISSTEIKRVAAEMEMEEAKLFTELMDKNYILDLDFTINQALFHEFLKEYPKFNVCGIHNGKVIDRNIKPKGTVKIRRERYKELEELWKAINKKYILFIDQEINRLIETELPSLNHEEWFFL